MITDILVVGGYSLVFEIALAVALVYGNLVYTVVLAPLVLFLVVYQTVVIVSVRRELRRRAAV